MAFLDETAKLLGIDERTSAKTFLYLCAQKGVLVEGYKKIYELSNSKITLLCEDGKKVVITGENLEIKEISHKEITISGKIISVNFE